MDRTINDCLVKLISDYEKYYDTKYGRGGRWSKPQFPFLILTLAVYLELPVYQCTKSLEELRDYLLDYYVGYSDVTQKNVIIEEYYQNDNYKKNEKFYMWSVLHYTYGMEYQTEEEKQDFLYMCIIFPYIYKLNTFNQLCSNDFDILNTNFNILQYKKNLESNMINKLDEEELKKYFQKAVRKVRTFNELLPSNDMRDTIIEEAGYGAKLMMWVYKDEEKCNGENRNE